MIVAFALAGYAKYRILRSAYSRSKEYLKGKTDAHNLRNLTQFALKFIYEGMALVTLTTACTVYNAVSTKSMTHRIISCLALPILGIAFYELMVHRYALSMIDQFACNRLISQEKVSCDDLSQIGRKYVADTQSALFLKVSDDVAQSCVKLIAASRPSFLP